MTDPNEMFAVVPYSGNAPDEAIITGNLSQVTEYIPQSVSREEAEQRLAEAEQRAAATPCNRTKFAHMLHRFSRMVSTILALAWTHSRPARKNSRTNKSEMRKRPKLRVSRRC
jgi:hypothetical protein